MSPRSWTLPLALTLVIAAPAPAHPGGLPGPRPDLRPDTVTCVVDTTAPSGLRMVPDVERGPSSPPSPALYAAGHTWFVNGDQIVVGNRMYVQFGFSQRMLPGLLVLVGETPGVGRRSGEPEVPVFAEPGEEAPYEVVYVPVRPGCHFQPYRMREQIRIRG